MKKKFTLILVICFIFLFASCSRDGIKMVSDKSNRDGWVYKQKPYKGAKSGGQSLARVYRRGHNN